MGLRRRRLRCERRIGPIQPHAGPGRRARRLRRPRTHVAGIAAGNDPGFTGVAPDALLGAYRVFGCNGSTDTGIILSAMERAAKDGMDVVNISIGVPYMTWPTYPTARGADSLSEAGVVVTASQGNAGNSGLFSASAPAVAEKAIAVGSVDNAGVLLGSFNLADGTSVGYLPVKGASDAPTEGSYELVSYPDGQYPDGQKAGAVDLPGRPSRERPSSSPTEAPACTPKARPLARTAPQPSSSRTTGRAS